MKVQRMTHPITHSPQLNRVHPESIIKKDKAMQYCHPLNDISQGQEGKSPVNGSLEFVAVMIRHGDRAPFKPIRNQSIINCGTVNNTLFQEYLKTLKHLRGSAKQLAPFRTFPLHPTENHCVSTQLTVLGAHQLLMVGHSLKKSYIQEHGLLGKNWISNDIKLYSTVFSRTFQSMVAFLFGFLPTFNISSIKIIPSQDDRFCMTDYYCNCPLAYQLEKLRLRKRIHLPYSHPAVLHLVQQLSPIVKQEPTYADILDPFDMFDCLMGYVCHGSHLPCTPVTNDCVTVEHVNKLIAYLDWIRSRSIKDSNNVKADVVNMQGFLNHLVTSINNYTNGQDPARFFVYAGHDVTLEPLLNVLGISDGNMIPYASRLVFEVYSYIVNNKQKYVIKVLFNGRDLTKSTSFCKSYFIERSKNNSKFHSGLCPLESFQKFVEDVILTIGFPSFQAACNSVHVKSFPSDAGI